MRTSALAPLRSHLRWTYAAWRSAHPLVLAAFVVCCWALYHSMLDSQEGWGWFSFEMAFDWKTFGWALLVGFLVATIQDGTGRDDPSLGYQSTRPLSRRAMLTRSLTMPLLAGAFVFLVWNPARDYRENVRIWWPERQGLSVFTSFLQDGRAMSRGRVSFSESRRRGHISGSQVELFRASGLFPLAGGYEYWYRNPEIRAEAEKRYKSNPTRTKQQRADHEEYRREFEEYGIWRTGRGPLTENLRKHGWWAVVPSFNLHWYVWGGWFMAFACGVLLRAWMMFGQEAGTLGGLRRVVTVRNLVPVGLLAYALRADRWLPFPGEVYGWSIVRRVIIGAYLHGSLYLALAVAMVFVPGIILDRGLSRRDLT